MSNAELLDRAVKGMMCDVLAVSGQSLLGIGVYSLWASGTGVVPLSAGALSLLAANYACADMPMGGQDPAYREGCQYTPNGGAVQRIQPNIGQGGCGFTGEDWVEIVSIEFRDASQGEAYKEVRLEALKTDGTTHLSSLGEWFLTETGTTFTMVPKVGDACGLPPDGTLPVPPDATAPREYTDPVTNCTYNVILEGFVQVYEGGAVSPVFMIEGTSTLRSSGGRMGGCNFPPTIYSPTIGGGGGGGGSGGGGGGGGGPYLPAPDPIPGPGSDGEPWWLDPLSTALGAVLLEKVVDGILDALQPPMVPTDFTLTAPCDKDDAGNALTRKWEFPEQSYSDRVIDHQVALMEIMQQHLDWKTPTCSTSEKPKLEGTWISTHWRSDADSPGGTQPLRKLFRYRSKSTRTNDELQVYWSDFVWTSGSVCVIHKGAWWGTPQVWAATAEEGKRVIRFAGAEAGLDPDQTGEWTISSSNSSRYGMSLKVRLAMEQGERWVTRREGPSGSPEL